MARSLHDRACLFKEAAKAHHALGADNAKSVGPGAGPMAVRVPIIKGVLEIETDRDDHADR